MAQVIDYHVHTDTSLDCKTPMAIMCMNALQVGVTEIAFTDHLNHHLLDMDLGYYNPDRYFDEITRCRANFPTLTIRAAVELGEPHRAKKHILSIIERYPYDLVLGSLHWVGNESMFNPNYFRSRTPEVAYGTYFAELVTMIRHGGFDILAHMDVPKRVGADVYNGYDASLFEDGIREVWQACIDTGIIT